jgi:glycosyltransferase 2 family protein
LKENRHWSSNRYFAIGKWIILLVLLYFAVKFVNIPDVISNLKKISLLTLVSFFALILSGKIFYAFRWYLICVKGIDASEVSILFSLRTNLLAEFVGIAIPSSLGGEAVRVMKLNEYAGTTLKSTVAVMSDRLIGLISMGLLLLAFLPKLHVSDVKWPTWSANIALWVLLIGALGLVSLLIFLKRIRNRFALLHTMKNFNLSLFLIMVLLLLSCCGHLLFASGYYLLFHEIHPIPFLVSTVLVFSSQLARIIPISIIGIGFGEISIVSLASLLGIKPQTTLIVVLVALSALYFYAIFGLMVELICDGKAYLATVLRNTPESINKSEIV